MTEVAEILEASNGMALMARLERMTIAELVLFAAKCSRLQRLTNSMIVKKLKERKPSPVLKQKGAAA